MRVDAFLGKNIHKTYLSAPHPLVCNIIGDEKMEKIGVRM
jgi:hypothetical protein